ncbi:DMT family transporter [Amphiplicatus metriothermophilus]|uniref:O-acetylserine/cysteine efflux transporter n=1 Tax=Amphiplicatus metriothermophilus TaxID=1519374 RepID=A0A239PQT8_9PROT|nr:DMT family transporter [Amphiplicatus metriothermophilus]MBB5518331.1 O-acetylserine/cysteine efflux transporter [Amphiplicatus metriothermophilus]SNT72498.1 O-acetylserine/cysteine efflux transporter [Amphiplicatus metriothermophilus]
MSLREFFVLLAICTVWGLHFVVVKTAVGAVPSIFYAAMRMSLVALVMAPFLRWRPGQMGRVLTAGLCLGAANYALLFTGLRHATASASAVAIELYVPFATILSVVFLGEKVGWRRALGVALAFVGVAIIALGRGEARLGFGVGLVALAAFVEACGAILVKRATGFRPHELLAWFAATGSAALWAATWALERGQGAALAASDHLMVFGAVAYSALGASIFAHTAYYWLLQRLPVSQAAVSGLLTTLLAVAFSIALLGEPLTWRFAVGGTIALAGVGLVLLRSAKKAPIIAASAPPAASADMPGPAAGATEPKEEAQEAGRA